MGFAQCRGRAGEALAAAYYELLGCEVLARNLKLGGVEVDLLVSDRGTRVLVEVKLRGRSDFGGAALAVDRAKRERLLRAARALQAGAGAADARARRDARSGCAALRIDVVAIEPMDEGLRLRHYRGAVSE